MSDRRLSYKPTREDERRLLRALLAWFTADREALTEVMKETQAEPDAVERLFYTLVSHADALGRANCGPEYEAELRGSLLDIAADE